MWQTILFSKRLTPYPSMKLEVVKLGEKAEDKEESGAVSQSVSVKGDYAELRAVIEHRWARPHLHLSLLLPLIGSCT